MRPRGRNRPASGVLPEPPENRGGHRPDRHTVPLFRRQKRHLHLPIWTSVILMTTNVTLMVVLIVLLAQQELFIALTIGAVAFGISLFGISFYLALTIKEIQLNRRQANFVDSVTHELKTPIASLKLYLETLQMRSVTPEQQADFYKTMQQELVRLDGLINQLLKVGRLDAIGHESPPEEIQLSELLQEAAEAACGPHARSVQEVFRFEGDDVVLQSRRMLLEMIFRNLLDNAVKYGGATPVVVVKTECRIGDRVQVRVTDNGAGIPRESRKRIFGLFYRDGDELCRTRAGTGLGLYIVRTLVRLVGGRVSVEARPGPESGSVFVVDLPLHAPLTRKERQAQRALSLRQRDGSLTPTAQAR